MELSEVYIFVGNMIYPCQAAVAIWGAWCAVLVYRRVKAMQFRSEDAQTEFMSQLDEPLVQQDFQTVVEACENDRRVMPQLVLLAVNNRDLGFSKVRQLVLERFQQDVLADFEHRLAWVNTAIKSAPMLGLLGTVLGMMGAFGKLASAENVKPENLAGDIMLALITTAVGLVIAIPLILALTVINVNIRKLEDLVTLGTTRFFENFRTAMSAWEEKRARQPHFKEREPMLPPR
jgi:biopolymer transport protein ExbB/TolQ